MDKITWGLWYWPYYLIAAAFGFSGPEIYAFFTNSNNTLSDYSWFELDIFGHFSHHTLAWYSSQVAWLMFVIVITMHIWYKVPS